METSRAYLFDHCIATLQTGMVRDAPHKHVACQLTVSLDGIAHSVGEGGARMRPGRIHLVGPGVPHALHGNGGEQLLLWLAPESDVSRRFMHTYLQDGDMAVLPDEQADGLALDQLSALMHAGTPAAALRPHVDALLSTLGRWTRRSPVAVHPAVAKALRIIRSLETANISADELASRVGLSRSRFLHVFKDTTGTPLRPYLQWRRCIDVMWMLGEGRTVTDAAVTAGFTDGAHCNRVLKKYVCVSPSALFTPDLEVRRHWMDVPSV